jgi:hypothetical protein
MNRRTLQTIAAVGVIAGSFLITPNSGAGAAITDEATIRTIAGRVGVGDGGPALDASLINVTGVTVDSSGRTVITTGTGIGVSENRVRRIAPDGTISVIAGNGTATIGVQQLGADARTVPLPQIAAVLGIPGNRVLLSTQSSVLVIEADGTLQSFANSARPAGNCTPPAPSTTTLYACQIFSMTFDPAGTVYLADIQRNIISSVSATGVVSRFAGVEHSSYLPPTGDGGPAVLATINPTGITYANGYVYVGQAQDFLRRIGSDGVIETLPIRGVLGVFGSQNGKVLFRDNYGISRLATDGTVSQFAGGPTSINDPRFGGLAVDAIIGQSLKVAEAPDGSVLISQGETDEVYRVATNGIISPIAGRRNSPVEPASSLSLLGATSVTRLSSGATLVTEGGSSSRVWKLENGSFKLVAGKLGPQFGPAPLPVRSTAFQRFIGIRRAVEGCSGDVYIQHSSGISRISNAGEFVPIPTLTAFPIGATFGGTCGSVFVAAGPLLEVLPDDTTIKRGDLSFNLNVLAPDAEGGILLGPQPFSKRSPDGTTTTIAADFTGVRTQTGYVGFTSTAPNSLRLLRNGVDSELAQVTPLLQGATVDGLLSANPNAIRALAPDAQLRSSLTVLDRGFLRRIQFPFDRSAATAVAPPSAPRARVPVSPSNPAIALTPRTAAPPTDN